MDSMQKLSKELGINLEFGLEKALNDCGFTYDYVMTLADEFRVDILGDKKIWSRNGKKLFTELTETLYDDDCGMPYNVIKYVLEEVL